MFRNSYQSSLKPSYVMYIAQNNLDSSNEKSAIDALRKQMQDAGLNVPLVIFDTYSIGEKMKESAFEIEK